jgi:hypothetical protein
MRYINSIVVAVTMLGLLAIGSTQAFANSEELTQTSKIKLYTGTATGAGSGNLYSSPFNYPVEMSLVINNELVIAQNMPGTAESQGWSYIEVDRKFNFQEISEAKFTWINAGKNHLCKASDMPLYVQEGPFNVGTFIVFNCN